MTTSTPTLNDLIAARDQVQKFVVEDELSTSMMEGARCLLDEVIMR